MSLEAEQALVASAVESAEAYDVISSVVEPDDFTDDVQRCVWDACRAMREAGRAVDVVILGAFLDRSERWRNLMVGGGVEYLSELTNAARGLGAVTSYTEIVRNASVTRKLLEYCSKIADVAYSSDIDSDAKIGEAHALLTPLGDGVPDGFVGYKEAVKEAITDIINLVNSGGGLSGLSTGFSVIDSMTAGFQDGDLIVLAARPSMGKTALAMNIANHVAREHQVQVFSLEMSSAALATRSLSSLSSVNLGDIRKGNITDVEPLKKAQKKMNQLKLSIDDAGSLTVDQLRTRARIAARKNPPKLIVVDFLTLLAGQGETRTLEIGYVARSLKALAKELNCPVLVLAQLNRAVDQRPDKRPRLSDLRDSGEIEQAADVVMFNYLDEKYDEHSPRRGFLELLFAKQRNGETGSRFLGWKGQFQTFHDLEVPVPELKPQKSAAPFQNAKNKEDKAF